MNQKGFMTEGEREIFKNFILGANLGGTVG